MAEHQPIKREKTEEVEESSHKKKARQPLYDQLKAPEEGIVDSLGKPSVDRHAALLTDAHSDRQRANLVIQLQQSYGNAYVQRLINSRAVQAKLTVNPPDDEYEREADRVADAVTQTPTSEIQRQPIEEEEELQMKNSQVQRQPIEEEEELQMKNSQVQRQPIEEEEELQMKNSQVQRQVEEEEEEEIQPKASGGQPQMVSEDLETQINTARGSGQPLADSVRASLEPQFGYDFSQVRIHADAEADELSQQLGAEAFTTGHDIFFREGQYRPGTAEGKELLAHELTHIVQQGAAVPALQRKDGDTAVAEKITAPKWLMWLLKQKSMSKEVPDLKEETVTKVKAKIKADKKQEAINLIVTEVKDSKMPELNNAKCDAKPVIYDASVSGEGLTNYKTWDPVKEEVFGIYIQVGDRAFRSVPILYDTIMHEYQHLKQFIIKATVLLPLRLKEFEAYSWEVLHAHETGLIKLPDEMKDVGKRLKAQGWDKMTDEEKKANKKTYNKAIKIIRKAIGDKRWQP